MRKAVILSLLPLALVACSADKNEQAAEPVDYSGLVYEITAEEYPKTYKAWGEEWVNKINGAMLPAVETIAKNRGCNEPVMINLSEQESIPQEKAVYFVDCENSRRFYIALDDVSEGKDVYTDSDVKRRVKDKQSLQLANCEIVIKDNLKNPKSFKKDISTVQHGYDTDKNHDTITFRFYGQNGFGAEVANIGSCSYDNSGALVDIKIQ